MSLMHKITLLFVLSSIAPSSYGGLDPAQRPNELKTDIQMAFEKLSSITVSKDKKIWRYFGETRDSYSFMHIDTAELAKVIIKTAASSQKDFYFLDIGSGKFGWAKYTANYLNRQQDIPDDVTIHIVSVTGENHGPLIIKKSGRCKLYNISSFKIEDLKDSFEKLSLDFNNKFDLITSQYTFLHLLDPVGTFVQAYNLLRPGTGLMLMEGLPVYLAKNEPDDLNTPLFDLLVMTKAPFLIGQGRVDRWIASFLLKRPDDKPLELPLQYDGRTSYITLANSFAKSFANFSIEGEYLRPFDEGTIPVRNLNDRFYGDKALYEWLYSHYPPWQNIDTRWFPLFKNDQSLPIEHLNMPRYAPPRPQAPPDPLFEAAENGSLAEFKSVVTNDNVNQKDKEGTPLLMLLDDEKLYWLLENSGLFIDINAQDKYGNTILFDFYPIKEKEFLEGRQKLLKLLISHGANINIQNKLGFTPLHRAIMRRVTDVVKFLIMQGADTTLRNKKGLTPLDLPQAQEPEIKSAIQDFS